MQVFNTVARSSAISIVSVQQKHFGWTVSFSVQGPTKGYEALAPDYIQTLRKQQIFFMGIKVLLTLHFFGVSAISQYF